MRVRSSRIVFIVAAVFCAPAMAPLLPQPVAAAHKDAAPTVAPAFRLRMRSGFVDSDSLRGKVVLLDFWASWCAPCQRSFPWMSSVNAKYASRGLAIVAVNLDKEQELAEEFLVTYPAPFTVAFDPEGKTAEAYHVAAMPTTFLISSDGRILSRHQGFDPKKTASFEAEIEGALPK
jgi:cytochrome c biogenesis protein CcmG, thiol:disulfide interchange protein DsbE